MVPWWYFTSTLRKQRIEKIYIRNYEVSYSSVSSHKRGSSGWASASSANLWRNIWIPVTWWKKVFINETFMPLEIYFRKYMWFIMWLEQRNQFIDGLSPCGLCSSRCCCGPQPWHSRGEGQRTRSHSGPCPSRLWSTLQYSSHGRSLRKVTIIYNTRVFHA